MAKKISKSGSSSTDPLIQTKIVLFNGEMMDSGLFLHPKNLMCLENSRKNRPKNLNPASTFVPLKPAATGVQLPEKNSYGSYVFQVGAFGILTLRIQICPFGFPLCHGQKSRFFWGWETSHNLIGILIMGI